MTTDDRELAVADTDLVDWQQAITPALPNDDGAVEDWSRPGEQPHGGSAGVPTTASDYRIPQVDGYEWTEDDEPNLEGFLETAHGLGLTQQQVEGILEFYARGAAEAEADDDDEAPDYGAPRSIEGYKVPRGRWTEADAPLLQQFLTQMHNAGAPQAHVTAALRWYQEFVAQQQHAAKTLDATTGNHARLALSKYLRDVEGDGRLIEAWLDSDAVPAGLKHKIKSARLPSGQK